MLTRRVNRGTPAAVTHTSDVVGSLRGIGMDPRGFGFVLWVENHFVDEDDEGTDFLWFGIHDEKTGLLDRIDGCKL